jgi:GNAT superfamily N-acetyltransferase
MTPQSFDVDVNALMMDAGIVRIRTVRPTDAEALRVMYEGVSPNALWLRFFSVSTAVVAHDIEALTRAPDDNHASLLAEIGSAVVGVATFERLDDEPTHAEVAFLVDDAHRGRGVGTLLLGQLAALASTYGIVRFVAETLSVNAPMLHVFRDAGLPFMTLRGTEVVHVELSLQPGDDAEMAVDGRRGARHPTIVESNAATAPS